MDDVDLSFLPPVSSEPVDLTRSGGGLIPDGDYDFVIEDSILEKNDYGKAQLTQKLRVEAPPEHARRVLYRRINLQRDEAEQTQRTVLELRKDFHTLGEEWGGGPDLKEKHKALVGKRFKGRKKTGKNPKYFDVWVNGLAGDPIPVPEPGAAIDPAVGF